MKGSSKSATLFMSLWYAIFQSHIIILFSVLTRVTLSSSVDPKFEACAPVTCGNGQNISYPFYIKGKQEPFCGNPGFELSCGNNGFPILNLINTEYIIQKIFYNNHSIQVSNPAFSGQITPECFALAQNLTVGKYRFYFAHKQRDIFLLYGCNLTSLSPGVVQEHRIECSEQNQTNSVLAFYGDDRNSSSALKTCKVRGTTKVEDGKGRIQEALRNGFVLNWNASNCSTCSRSGGRCGFDPDRSIYAFRCYCPDRVHAVECNPQSETKRLSKAGKVAIGLGAGLLISILMIGLLFLLYTRKHGSSENTYSDSSSNPAVETGNVYFGIPLFSYKELEEATSRFDINNQIGDGGFGTVYFGKLQDEREVAVKRLYEHNYRREEQFMNEVQILTRLRHKNLVSLYGCTSRQSRELLLVYEYIPNGTLAAHLHGESAAGSLLPWSTRIKIAIETANALAYLHASDIIHRDVKTNNILLDHNFCVKVADFGLSRLFPNDVTHVSTAPQGTPGYVDPEYYQCYQLTSKSDVYSFGVVLIELISSLPAVDMRREKKDEINLSNLAIKKIQESAVSELVDPCLGFDSDSEVRRMVVSVAELAFQCLQRDKELRPSMDKVLEALRRIESQEQLEEAGLPQVGVSHSNVQSQPSSPVTVTDGWESKSTTPNISG